ncbi:MAG: hypothetical protein QNJ40_21925 [Xanthomonadales bacterium]|nr:hypothetical protein [Xanthomonadales bacterium]
MKNKTLATILVISGGLTGCAGMQTQTSMPTPTMPSTSPSMPSPSMPSPSQSRSRPSSQPPSSSSSRTPSQPSQSSGTPSPPSQSPPGSPTPPAPGSPQIAGGVSELEVLEPEQGEVSEQDPTWEDSDSAAEEGAESLAESDPSGAEAGGAAAEEALEQMEESLAGSSGGGDPSEEESLEELDGELDQQVAEALETAGGGMPAAGGAEPAGGGQEGGQEGGSESEGGGGTPGSEAGAASGTGTAGTAVVIIPGDADEPMIGEEGGLDAELESTLEVFEGEMQRTITILASARGPGEGELTAGGSMEETGESPQDQTGGGADLILVDGDPSLLPSGGSAESGEELQDGDVLVAGGMPGGTRRNDGYQRVPDDVGDGSDDDVVARQIREAAINEDDPVLREKLWEEYRNYKRSIK